MKNTNITFILNEDSSVKPNVFFVENHRFLVNKSKHEIKLYGNFKSSLTFNYVWLNISIFGLKP